MSTPASALTGLASAAQSEPSKPLTAIELIEQELANFVRQREQAIANVHAVDGAIQSAQHLLAKLKAEIAKAEAFAKAEVAKAEAEAAKAEMAAKKLAGEATCEVKKAAAEVEGEVSKGIHAVEAEAKKL